jgi:hypothetical protein
LALSPLALGLTTGPYLWWASHRLHDRKVAVEAWSAAAIFVAGVALDVPSSTVLDDIGTSLLLGLMLLGTGRALMLRRRIRGQATAQSASTTPATALTESPASWNPDAFPAGRQLFADPSQPTSWTASLSLVCNGRDEHCVGLTPSQAWTYAAVGAAITGACVLLHTSEFAGTGGGLMTVPIFAPLVRQRLHGPVVKYRRWGVAQDVHLDTAVAVTAATRWGRCMRRTLAVTGPSGENPVRVRVGTSGQVAVRAHLAGWLLREGVSATPEAAAMLRERTWTEPSWVTGPPAPSGSH